MPGRAENDEKSETMRRDADGGGDEVPGLMPKAAADDEGGDDEAGCAAA